MPREIEAKLRVDSHDPVRERLRAAGAELIARVLETNRIFDRPDAALRRKGCGLRIRTATPEDSTADGKVDPTTHPSTLTFKGAVVAGPFKSREELEIQVSHAETAVRILDSLGFVQVLCYQKRRESWRLGECLVELDEPPHIGLFVEIEGPSESAIRAVQADLGLKGAPHVSPSYVRMLAAYCDEHGITSRVVNLNDH